MSLKSSLTQRKVQTRMLKIFGFTNEVNSLVDEHKLLPLCLAIQQYYESINTSTQVLPASLKSTEEIFSIAGVHHITIPPDLLEQLRQPPSGIPKSLLDDTVPTAPVMGPGVSFMNDPGKYQITFARDSKGASQIKLTEVCDWNNGNSTPTYRKLRPSIYSVISKTSSRRSWRLLSRCLDYVLEITQIWNDLDYFKQFIRPLNSVIVPNFLPWNLQYIDGAPRDHQRHPHFFRRFLQLFHFNFNSQILNCTKLQYSIPWPFVLLSLLHWSRCALLQHCWFMIL